MGCYKSKKVKLLQLVLLVKRYAPKALALQSCATMLL